MKGEKDWDWVSIDDYKKDMLESAQDARYIIESLTRERDELKRLLVAACASNGGELRISKHSIAAALRYDVLYAEDYEKNELVLRTRWATIGG